MLDNLEKIAKIISLIAIPIVIWWLGTEYQSADTKAKTAVEYVKLSISIITNESEADPGLYVWATETLNHYSNVKFTKQLKQELASGKANITPSVSAVGWFAVVGSLESKKEAIEFIELLNKSKPQSLKPFDFVIYKTKISQLYAVTVGGETTKADALSRASLARENGWVSDAFAQRNKGWEREKI